MAPKIRGATNAQGIDMAHKHKGSDPETHRMSPPAKRIIQNTRRARNMAQDAAKPHRHRPKQTDDGW